MSVIRKISVGLGYPDNCIHYQVDKPVRMAATSANIVKIQESIENEGVVYKIYTSVDNGGAVLWKKISGVPVIIEYLVDFD